MWNFVHYLQYIGMSFELNDRQGDFYTVLSRDYSEIFREVYGKIYRKIVVRFEIPDREIHALKTFVLHNFIVCTQYKNG